MADPNEVVRIYHAEANPSEGVEVTRQDYETVWKTVGWKLQPQSKNKEK